MTSGTGGASGTQVEPKKIASAGVVGAGVMGQGIAAANVKRGIPVALMDADQTALARGVQGVLNEVAYNQATKRPDVKRAIELAPLVNGTFSDIELCHSDLIIEAIFEDRDAKQHLFARLEPLMRDDAILCSNTSTIPITQLAEGLEQPERFCGLHFFNPVRQMQLVEVIRGAKTSDATIATAVAYAQDARQVADRDERRAGLLGESVAAAVYERGGAAALAKGRAFRRSSGRPRSLACRWGRSRCTTWSGSTWPCMPAGRWSRRFRIGSCRRRSSSGCLSWGASGRRLATASSTTGRAKGGKPPRGTESPEVTKVIDECRVPQPRKFTADEITDRLFLPMLVEATRVLEDGLVRDVRDVDLALIYGIGFPPFRGGLFFWADQVGVAKIVEKLRTIRVARQTFRADGDADETRRE